MDRWSLGLIVLIVVGLTVIIYGALSDRAKTKKAAAEMLAPPKREIPNFRPDAPAPHYLSQLQAHRPPAGADSTDLTATEREQLRTQLADRRTSRIRGGYASADFVTDQPTSWAVLEHPGVLVCAEPIETVRELLPILEQVSAGKTPLVLVAPRFLAEVLDTLGVNHIRGLMQVVAVCCDDPEAVSRVAAITGTAPIERADLQSGYLVLDQLGRCQCWISDAQASYVVATVTERTDS